MEKPYTPAEIAKICHVSHRTVLVWIEEGKLSVYKTPGGHNRIKRPDFIEFLKKHKMPIPIGEGFHGPRKRILIFDDDKNMVNAIVRVIKRENIYDIEVASDGFDAGRKLLEFMPDMVILDIRMPGIDGYAVTKRIKLIPHDKHVKIIAISAFFEEEGKAKIMSYGAAACLDKPVENEELLKLIKKQFDQ